MHPDHFPGFIELAQNELRADVLVITGDVWRGCATDVLKKCSRRQRRSGVLLVLTTKGGDARSAYRIARCLRRAYYRISVLLPSYCRGAGTLLLFGADELVVTEHTDLGGLEGQEARELFAPVREANGWEEMFSSVRPVCESLGEKSFYMDEIIALLSPGGSALN
jgi:membrane-bound ClpP family serine protease